MSSPNTSNTQTIIIPGIIWLAITIKTSLTHFSLGAFTLWLIITLLFGLYFVAVNERPIRNN